MGITYVLKLLQAPQAAGTQPASLAEQILGTVASSSNYHAQAAPAASEVSHLSNEAPSSVGIGILSEQAATVSGSETATSLAPDQLLELDLTAAESLSPESASVSLARLQSPDQALPGLTAFQKRLHSMLPQLPALEKLAQLTEEVRTACDLLPLTSFWTWLSSICHSDFTHVGTGRY